MDYRCIWHQGGTYFFTVNLLQRRGNDLLVRHIQSLREAVRDVKAQHPFEIHGWVVLPEHFHSILELPCGDADYATRLRLIKMGFSKSLPKADWVEITGLRPLSLPHHRTCGFPHPAVEPSDSKRRKI